MLQKQIAQDSLVLFLLPQTDFRTLYTVILQSIKNQSQNLTMNQRSCALNFTCLWLFTKDGLHGTSSSRKYFPRGVLSFAKGLLSHHYSYHPYNCTLAKKLKHSRIVLLNELFSLSPMKRQGKPGWILISKYLLLIAHLHTKMACKYNAAAWI